MGLPFSERKPNFGGVEGGPRLLRLHLGGPRFSRCFELLKVFVNTRNLEYNFRGIIFWEMELLLFGAFCSYPFWGWFKGEPKDTHHVWGGSLFPDKPSWLLWSFAEPTEIKAIRSKGGNTYTLRLLKLQHGAGACPPGNSEAPHI